MIRTCLSFAVCLLACSLFACWTSTAAAEDWPQFRGPGGLGVSTATGLPVEWNDQQLHWKTPLPGHGASSPIALSDKLYVTCYSGYGLDRAEPGDMQDLRLHLVCVNHADGQIQWNSVLEPRLPESERVRDHGYAGPTPATDGEFLYVFFGRTGVFKFDLDGNQIWQATVGDRTHGWGCGTSPVLYKNLVIVNASVESGSLVALDKQSGDEVWRADGIRQSWNTPHLVELAGGRHELVVSVQGKILGFDPATGQQLWYSDGIDDYVCPSVVSQDGVVYAIGGRTSRAFAIRAGGRGDVTETHTLWEAKAGANVCSPVIHDGYLYWVSDRNRAAYCVRLEDGEVMYEERMRSQPYASALAADGRIYIVTRQGATYVLAAQPKFEELAVNTLDDDSTFNASPIVANGHLILRSDEYLYCIGK